MSVHRSFKGTERSVARLLGGQRTGHLGGADVTGKWFSAEVKHREKLPEWIKDAMGQAVRHSEEGQLPLVVLHEMGAKHADNLVMIRLADFRDWFVSRADTDPDEDIQMDGAADAAVDRDLEVTAGWKY